MKWLIYATIGIMGIVPVASAGICEHCVSGFERVRVRAVRVRPVVHRVRHRATFEACGPVELACAPEASSCVVEACGPTRRELRRERRAARRAARYEGCAEVYEGCAPMKVYSKTTTTHEYSAEPATQDAPPPPPVE